VPDVTVTHEPSTERYEAKLGDEVAGFAIYREKPGLIAFVHTEVDPKFEGQGVGSALAKGALEDARARELAVLPFCPFFNGYIQRHAEYADLVPANYQERFGL
jgi:predicted GNAT family acetyltransferase